LRLLIRIGLCLLVLPIVRRIGGLLVLLLQRTGAKLRTRATQSRALPRYAEVSQRPSRSQWVLLILLRRSLQSLLIALVVQPSDHWSLSQLLLTSEVSRCYPGPVPAQRTLSNGVARQPLLSLLVLIVELVLRGVNHVLRIRILVVLDLLLSKRIGGVPRYPDRLVDRTLSIVRILIDPANPGLLLGVNWGCQLARVGLIGGAGYALSAL